MKQLIILLITINISSFGAEVLTQGTFVKEKKEIESLKTELTIFYDKNEKEYQERKKGANSTFRYYQETKTTDERII